MKFLHAADVHLDSPLRGLDRYEGAPADEIRGATRKALVNLVTLALDEEVDFVILAGDLFDGDWPDFNTGLFFVRQMARLAARDIRVYAVRGNHDAESKMTRKLPWPRNVHFFSHRQPESVALEGFDAVIHGQSYAQQKVVADLAAGYPAAAPGKINIGVLHTSLDGREGHAAYAPTTLGVLKSRGYDYWALGHVHTRELVGREPLVVFPGNLQGRHIKEPGTKGCELVTLTPEGLRNAHRPLDVLRWTAVDVDITGAADGDEVLDRTATALRSVAEGAGDRLSAVRVSIAGRSAAHQALSTKLHELRQQVRALAIDLGRGSIWIEKVIVAISMPFDLGALKDRSDPIGELVRQLEILTGGDGPSLEALRAELQSLRQRLPVEIAQEGRDAAGELRRLCERLGPELVSRALGRERES